jgi:RHS repeat-associated protein
VYNALGQRVEKHPGTAYTELVYDAFGSPIGSHNRTTWATYFVPFGGRTLVRYQDNKTYFMHPNHLESATFVTDQTGTPVEKTLYYPWGQTWASAGPYVYTSFAGMYPADGETGNDPTLFRMYNPRLYRWLSPDPLAGDILNPQSLNRYAYVLNNPVNLIDPLGLDPPQGPPPHPGCGDDPTIQCVYQRYHWSIPGYFGAGTVCYIDGVRDSCDRAFSLVESGAAFPVPPEDQGWRPTTNQRDCPGCFVNGQDVLWDPENQATWQGTIWVVSLTIDSDWFQRRLSPNNMRKTPPKPTVSSPGHPSYKWFDFVKCTVSENMMNLFGGDQAVMSLGLPIGTAVAATAQRWEFAIPAATATAIHYSNAFLKSNAACTQEVYGQVP